MDKDFTYRCGFLPPLLLAILLIALPQLAKAADGFVSEQQIAIVVTNYFSKLE